MAAATAPTEAPVSSPVAAVTAPVAPTATPIEAPGATSGSATVASPATDPASTTTTVASTSSAPADLSASFTAADETTMHGELPPGFWEDEDAVPLFVPTDSHGAIPPPQPESREDTTETIPAEPAGERYAQLQALFPGRIIEVSRPSPAQRSEAATGEPHDRTRDTGYPAIDGNAADLADGSDEPRYDTAAEAAAEE